MIRTLSLALALVLGTQTLAEVPSLPFPAVGGAFDLTDQFGVPRNQTDPDGAAQLLFFGYANCQQICSSVLPQMAEVVENLTDQGRLIRPVMITVDPEVDSIEKLASALMRYHPDFVGLTGSETELQVAYDAFQVEKKVVFEDPEYGAVYAHSGFIYLLDGTGKLLTLLPPILDNDAMTAIIVKYLPLAT